MKNIKNLAMASALSFAAASCGGGSDDSSTDTSIDPTAIDSNDFTPAALAISLPTTLTTSSNSSGGLRLTQEEPGASSSQGYWELTEKVQRIQFQLAELTLNNAILDNVYTTSCGGSIATACTVENACATITQQIVNNLKDTIGEEHFEDDYSPLSFLMTWSGKHCFPNLTLSAVTDSSDGYAYQAVISFDESNGITQQWIEDKTKVKIVHT